MFCSELGAKYDTMEFFTLVWVSFILPAFEGATVLTFIRVWSLLAVPLSKIKIMRGKVSSLAGVKARVLSQMFYCRYLCCVCLGWAWPQAWPITLTTPTPRFRLIIFVDGHTHTDLLKKINMLILKHDSKLTSACVDTILTSATCQCIKLSY